MESRSTAKSHFFNSSKFYKLFSVNECVSDILMSTPSNVSVPAALQYSLTVDERLIVSLASNQVNLPTDLPEGPCLHNFTLSSGGYMFNGVIITVTSNAAFQWVAIGRIIFCATVIEGLCPPSLTYVPNFVYVLKIITLGSTILIISATIAGGLRLW